MDHTEEYRLGSVANRQKTMSQSSISPEGEGAVWGGRLSEEGRPHVPGNSRGPQGIQVLKYPTPYTYEPITQCAKKGKYFEAYTKFS